MTHDIAKLLLAHAGTFLERTEAIKTALGLGMPLHEIEQYLDWLDANRGGVSANGPAAREGAAPAREEAAPAREEAESGTSDDPLPVRAAAPPENSEIDTVVDDAARKVRVEPGHSECQHPGAGRTGTG
ncbi:MAG: hypothetical protein J5I93_29310 [Pirellulaceae bacterium]|nr:hypothetical protein [Pirellulaceae bacterium]